MNLLDIVAQASPQTINYSINLSTLTQIVFQELERFLKSLTE